MIPPDPALEVERLLDAGRRIVIVDSPPGAGKSRLALDLAERRRGSQVALLTPRAGQAVSLVRRLLARSPGGNVRLSVGRDRWLPEDLADHPARRPEDGLAWGARRGPAIEVFTLRKFTLAVAGMVPGQYGLALLDEAYLAMAGDLEMLLPFCRQIVLLGDPGQLPPLVTVDARRFDAAPVRVHRPMPEEVRRLDPATPVVRLPASHRLPPDSAGLLQPALYPDLPFRSSASACSRRLHLAIPGRAGDPVDRALDLVASGMTVAALLRPGIPPPGPVDPGLARDLARLAARLLERGASWPGGPIEQGEIGIIDPRVAMESAIRRELGRLGIGREVRIGTPETFQGEETAITLCRHPLQPGAEAFSLDPGRWCVALTRHRIGCIVVGRAGILDLLEAPVPPQPRPLGEPDRTWAGRQAHRRLLGRMASEGRIVRTCP